MGRTIRTSGSRAKIAAADYIKGEMTLSEAARKAKMPVQEMEKYLVDNGYKSTYSIADLRKELGVLKSRR